MTHFPRKESLDGKIDFGVFPPSDFGLTIISGMRKELLFSCFSSPSPFQNHLSVSVEVGMEDDIVAVSSLLLGSF